MFSPEERDHINEVLVERARSDRRIVAAAAVGGSASGGDRWSDLDLTFGVADDVPVTDVLADWTDVLVAELGATVLFDLPAFSSIYRVFLLPGMLQVDLSFTPASDFGARGPRFTLLFGTALDHPTPPAPSPSHALGLAVHHIVRSHICVARDRLWQAEYWLHEARDEVMTLACTRLGLPAAHGRGIDGLPPNLREVLERSLVGALTVADVRRALAALVDMLLEESEQIDDGTSRLRRLLAPVISP